MANSSDELPQIVEGMRQFNLSLSKSIAPFRWVGYGFLLYAAFDWILLFIPPQLMNPIWEFQTMGALVERIPVLLIALLLIFFGETSLRGRWERPLVQTLSWLCLVLGIIFFLMLPLGIVNTFRINQQNAVQATAEYNQQLEQAVAVEAELDAATPQEIIGILESQGAEVQVEDPDEIKEILRTEISVARENLDQEYTSLRDGQRTSLLKNSVKWNFGALMSGVLLLYLWRSTQWARRWPAKPIE
jgi:hypothetical protein